MQQAQPQLAVDPNLAAEQQQADQLNAQQLQIQSEGDTAAIMARYGARVALGGVAAVSSTPTLYVPPPSASAPGSQYQSSLPGAAGRGFSH
jgi:hypothetical protein